MQFKVLKKTKESLDIEFVDERETVLNLLKTKLLEDAKVETATFITDHPTLSNPRLVIHVNKGKPETALKNAASAARKELDALEDAFLDALK